MVQRHGVVIETCMVGNNDSAFLQQAAHITEGLYLRPQRTSALLQYLLVSIYKLTTMLTCMRGVCCPGSCKTICVASAAACLVDVRATLFGQMWAVRCPLLIVVYDMRLR